MAEREYLTVDYMSSRFFSDRGMVSLVLVDTETGEKSYEGITPEPDSDILVLRDRCIEIAKEKGIQFLQFNFAFYESVMSERGKLSSK